MRAFGFDVRAGAPRRSQASSRVARFLRTCSATSARSSRSARPARYAAYRTGVPARRHVQVGRATVELEHLGGDLVEHVAVVGDQHQAAAEGGEPLLEELDGVEVEVVGRLVEDQHLVLADQQPGQRNALGLAARQLVGGRVEQRAPCPADRASPRPATRHRPPRAPSRPAAPGSAAGSPTRAPRPHRTSPASGRSSPASIRSSVLLPQPLSPTTPSRSPSLIVSETSANSGRFGRLAASRSASMRIMGGRVLSQTCNRQAPRGAWRFRWWAGKDSNLRRTMPVDLQSTPFGHSGTDPSAGSEVSGATSLTTCPVLMLSPKSTGRKCATPSTRPSARSPPASTSRTPTRRSSRPTSC